jgi:glycerol-3-phosphate O-acyltransferase / dihydroxyacetone phosphate acyltransferase
VWLLPHLARVSAAAVRVYYRASRSGRPVPAAGPVLLVGNHPNSLLDPAFLAWVAQRPVRFLAKEPLFRDRLVGWLVRGSGSLPVYREQDHPGQTARNADTFRAVYEALGAGAAVAIFPEGISHSLPSLAPLKTGAARIALGAAPAVGGAFPIVPVGLVFRAKDTFRSEAHAVVGAPIAWDDLAGAAVKAAAAGAGAEPADRAAVAELTARIEERMRAVTLNLARWEDDDVVRTAEAIWAAGREADGSPGAQVARLTAASAAWARLRASGDAQWDALAREVRDHGRVLRVLGASPATLTVDTRWGSALRWAWRRLGLLAVVQALLALVTALLFWLPYWATGLFAERWSPERDTLSTYKALGGAAVFGLWTLLLAALVAWSSVWWLGLASLLALPALGLLGLYAVEHWRETYLSMRRWWLFKADARVAAVLDRQHALAARLDAAWRAASQLG